MAENKKIDLNKFYKDLGISEQVSTNTARIRFLKYLIDLGIDVDSTEQTIEAKYNNEYLFLISDFSKYQMEITGNLKYLIDENIDAADLYKRIMDYASLDIGDRFKDIEIIRGEDE